MIELEALIRLARARLEGHPPEPTDIEQQRQSETITAFVATLKHKLEIDTWVNLHSMQGVWFKDGPALRFATDKFSSVEQQFYLRPIQGGFELGGPGDPVPLADDDQFNDQLLLAIGDALDAVRRRNSALDRHSDLQKRHPSPPLST